MVNTQLLYNFLFYSSRYWDTSLNRCLPSPDENSTLAAIHFLDDEGKKTKVLNKQRMPKLLNYANLLIRTVYPYLDPYFLVYYIVQRQFLLFFRRWT